MSSFQRVSVLLIEVYIPRAKRSELDFRLRALVRFPIRNSLTGFGFQHQIKEALL